MPLYGRCDRAGGGASARGLAFGMLSSSAGRALALIASFTFGCETQSTPPPAAVPAADPETKSPEPPEKQSPPPVTEPGPPLKATPHFFSWADDAKAHEGFDARTPATGHTIGFIDASKLTVGLSIHERPDASSPALTRLDNRGLVNGDGVACEWFVFHPLTEWHSGRARCGDVTENMGWPVFAVQGEGESQWLEVIADGAGRLGWVRSALPVRTLVDDVKDNIGYVTPFWDRQLYDEPGGKPRTVGDGDLQIEILETAEHEGVIWLKTQPQTDGCETGKNTKVGKPGWMRATNDAGEIQVWYELSC